MTHLISTEPNTAPNWPLLSLLRFGLALIVACSHLHHTLPSNNPFWQVSNFSPFNCVVAFFFISGFSIRHSYFRHADAGTKAFYVRRMRRILPEFVGAHLIVIGALILTAGFVAFPGGGSVELSGDPVRGLAFLFVHFLPIQGVLLSAQLWNGPAWSLGCEELYYAVSPLLLKISERVFWGIGAASLILHQFDASRLNESVGLAAPVLLFWVWLCGWKFAECDQARVRLLLALAPCLFMRAHAIGNYHAPQAPGIITALIFLNMDVLQIPARLEAAAKWLGDFSYTLYIAHVPAMLLICAMVKAPTPFQAIAGAVSVCVALHVVAWRFRAWRWNPARQVAAHPAT